MLYYILVGYGDEHIAECSLHSRTYPPIWVQYWLYRRPSKRFLSMFDSLWAC